MPDILYDLPVASEEGESHLVQDWNFLELLMGVPCSKKGNCSFTDSCVPEFCIPVPDCIGIWGIVPYLCSCFFGTRNLARKPRYKVFLASFGFMKRPTLIFPALWVCPSKPPAIVSLPSASIIFALPDTLSTIFPSLMQISIVSQLIPLSLIHI